MTHSELDTIRGIGTQTKQLLLLHYHSVDGIRKAGFEELRKLVGKGKANILVEYFTRQER